MIIDKTSSVPAYRQLKTYLDEGIRNAKWDGEIPSERQLVALTGVTRMTVRQAIGELVSEGKLYRIKGKGTFIAEKQFEQNNIMSFSDLMRERGITPRTKVILFDADCRDVSSLPPEWQTQKDGFYHLLRLRLAEDAPVGLEDVYLPHNVCPGLEDKDLGGSLYAILLSYGYKITGQDVRITAALPTAEQTEIFGISKTTPLLSVSGDNLTGERVPLFYEKSLYRSDRFSYKVNISDKY